MNTPVRDLLDSKGHEVITIGTRATVIEAVRLMEDRGIGSLIVVNKAGDMTGMLTERDCLWRVWLAELSPQDTPVQKVMTTKRKLTTVTLDDTVEACMTLMTQGRARHLAVMDRDKLVGLISIGDVVKFLVSEQQVMINNLEKYIEGSL